MRQIHKARRAVAAVSAAAVAAAPGLVSAGNAAVTPATNPCNKTPAALSTFQNPLQSPPVYDLSTPPSIGAVATGELREVPAVHQFDPAGQPGKTTPTWAYTTQGGDSTYLGPTIVARRGTPINLTVLNDLAGAAPPGVPVDNQIEHAPQGSTSVHLHGGHSDIESDGAPDDAFTGSRTYHFVNDQEAAGLWYHDHALGNTRLNVFSGLAAGYVLRDRFDTGAPGNVEGLPTGYDHYELPLILQDRSFNAPDAGSNQLSVCYPTGVPGAYTTKWIPEYFGDTAVVNGVVRPYRDVEQAFYRLRLYNGSQSRFYNLQLKLETATGTAIMYQIGDSGGLLNAPVRTPTLLIAPGQRADLLVDFRAAPVGATFRLTNNAVAPYPGGPHAGVRGGAPLPNVMQFRVTRPAAPGATITIPARLRGGAGQPPTVKPAQPCGTAAGCVKVRNIYLNEVLDAAGVPQRALVNNVTFDSLHGTNNGDITTVPLGPTGSPTPGATVGTLPAGTPPIETPAANTVEQWNFINTTADAHPMHLHLVHFRLIGRQSINTGNYLGLLNRLLAQQGYTTLPTWTGTATSPDGHGPWPAPSADPYVTGNLTPPAGNETGWMDTVTVPPGQITRILVPFGGDGQASGSDALTADGRAWATGTFAGRYNAAGSLPGGEAPYTGTFVDAAEPYVYHCHILEHEENDMMLGFQVTGTP